MFGRRFKNAEIGAVGEMAARRACCENGEMKHAVRGGWRLALLLGAGGLAGCEKVAPPTPLDQLNAQQTHGHAVYQVRCARCHYDRKDAPLHGPSMAGVFKRGSLPSGAPANEERVANVVRHGRNSMPAMGAAIDQETMDDLLAYLHTI